jgi:signal transduction histidine kinase
MTESLGRFTQKLTRSGSVFVGTLVHDLRNPLAAVHNSAQALLARRKLDDEQAGLVSQIETSTSLVKRLVSDLIDAVRIRLLEDLPIAPAPMDIGTAVQEAAEEAHAAKGADHEVVLSVHVEGAISRDAIATVFDTVPRGEGADLPREDENPIQSENARFLLGLFIAQGIVAAHGGKITVTSSKQEGTTFAAHLPRKKGKQ